MIYATKYSWIIISIILIIGALIRHFFNVKHTGSKPPYWIIIPVTILSLLTIYISYSGKPKLNEIRGNAVIIDQIPKPILANAQEIIVSKCTMCHLSLIHI